VVSRRRWDGFIWVVVGVSMVSQAAFIAGLAWWPEVARPRSDGGIPVPVASLMVAAAFVVSGVGAFYLAFRRLSAARRAR
jgi:hypothetical protein